MVQRYPSLIHVKQNKGRAADIVLPCHTKSEGNSFYQNCFSASQFTHKRHAHPGNKAFADQAASLDGFRYRMRNPRLLLFFHEIKNVESPAMDATDFCLYDERRIGRAAC